MWVLRWLGAAIIILVILGFALQNSDKQISVVFVKGVYETGELPLWLIIYCSFGLGMIFWLFFSIFQVFGLKSQIRRMKNENLKLQKELDNLRNLSIEEDVEIKATPEETVATRQITGPPPGPETGDTI